MQRSIFGLLPQHRLRCEGAIRRGGALHKEQHPRPQDAQSPDPLDVSSPRTLDTQSPDLLDALSPHPLVTEEVLHLERIRTHLVDMLRQGNASELAASGPVPDVGLAAEARGGDSGGGSNGGGGRSVGQLRFDADLLELRDEVMEAKAEDVAPLAEQMMRVAAIRAARGQGGRSEAPADPASPYFGHLRLCEGLKERDIFIGKRTYINAREGVVIVDWRNAPISSLYYRYEEGDDYDEEIAGRQREGLIAARRILSVVDGELRRIRAPQGVFLRDVDGIFREVEEERKSLRGGQGTALRPKAPAFVSRHRRAAQVGQGGRLGLSPDKHLPEISALLDAEQFRLITSGKGGLVVITGGAGSGKTTIGLHRIAFLAFEKPRRYRPDRMMVLVPSRALAAYISRVLPDLGLPGVAVRTLVDWLRRQRKHTLGRLRIGSEEESLGPVRRIKKHPGMLALIEDLVEERRVETRDALFAAADGIGRGELLRDVWVRIGPAPLALQLRGLLEWLRRPVEPGRGRLEGRELAAMETVIRRVTPRPGDLIHHWAELLTNRDRMLRLRSLGHEPLPAEEVEEMLRHAASQCAAVMDLMEAQEHGEVDGGRGRGRRRGEPDSSRRGGDGPGWGQDPVVGLGELDAGEDGTILAYLSSEDDAILLRLFQRLVGELPGPSGKRLSYAHLLLDEVQDLGVVELSVVLGCVEPEGSVTLAGDPAQRMVFDTGYGDWPQLLGALGLDSVAIEPLAIGYRSTAEIQRFAQLVLGPSWEDRAPRASRVGVPVEAFHFGDQGEAVVFLADALRALGSQEPMASVALITRYPAQADTYYSALRAAEVARLRRVMEQDFSFAPGIEITDVRQVKGLEFDYVLLLDVTAESYPDSAEARHLIHIAATRAAHQLWLIIPGKPSPVLEDLGALAP